MSCGFVLCSIQFYASFGGLSIGFLHFPSVCLWFAACLSCSFLVGPIELDCVVMLIGFFGLCCYIGPF